MSLALNLIFAAKAKSTHHKLALDSLRHLRSPAAEKWRDAFLYYATNYLQGAKAPDDEFKDFKNHVLHVSDNFWGGAVGAAKNWYAHLLLELRVQNWSEAAYCAGVLSHYYTDPLMPFHTAQSESEGAVHRAAEWSITKSYESLQAILLERLGGWPEVELTTGRDWLRDAIHAGACLSHPHYNFLIDHYNLDRGVKNPPEGLDGPSREILAQLLGYAAVGFARILDRAIEEAAVTPPNARPSTQTLFASLGAPIGAIAKKFTDQKERAQILAMYDEYVATGKCLITLPEDDRVIRANYAKEVLKVPLAQLDAEKPRKPGQQFGTGEAPRIVAISKPAVATSSESSTPRKPMGQYVTSLVRNVANSVPKRKGSQTPLIEAAVPLLKVEPQDSEGDAESDTSIEADAMPLVETQNLPATTAPAIPKRTVRQVATQFTSAMAPKIKSASAGISVGMVSLIKRLKPQPNPQPKPVTANEATPKATIAKEKPAKASEAPPQKTGVVNSFLSRFQSTPKPQMTSKTPAESETIEFVSSSEKKAKSAPASVSTSNGKYYLELKSSVEDGPSIGPKMASRMAQVGVKSVDEFLRADPIALGGKLGFNATASAKIKDWQDQARLVCRIPNLRGHDAQILIACGIREPKALASANAAALTKQAIEFAKSSEGQRLLRGASMPDAEEVKDWIEWAQTARNLKAA